MIKLWPASPDGQLTPRVGKDGRERQNPFEHSLSVQTHSSGSHTPSASAGALTPGSSHATAHHHALLHDAAHHAAYSPAGHLTPRSPTSTAFAQPTTSISITPPEFHMNQPPSKRPNFNSNMASTTTTTTSATPTSTTTLSSSSSTSSAAPSTSLFSDAALTVGAPSTNGTTPPKPATPSTETQPPAPASTQSQSSSRAPIGQITVKLISARGLNVASSRACPYVVAEFEHNEFVSRDPVGERGQALKGAPTPAPVERTNSHAAHALGAISLRARQADEAAALKKTKQAGSNPSSGGSTKSALSSGSGNGGSPTSLFGPLSAHSPVWKHEVSFDVTRQDSQVTLTIYDRASVDNYYLGTVMIKPILRHEHTVDTWYKVHGLSDDRGVTGEMRVQITFTQNKSRRALTPRDFEFLKLIGRGTFGRVFQVRKRDTKRIYAMKVLSKREIIAKKEVAHTIGERDILQRSVESPFLVGLKFSFQTENDLYLVTDFKSGGELFWHLQRETKFTEERARFYVAELVLALEHLHKYDIVYRDLKPENILLDAMGHVALCDFGLSKANLQQGQLTQTFCGTTEYLAPEVLLDEHGYSKLVDFWSLGVLLFEMCCGWSPFYAEDTQQMYKNICFGRIRFPRGAIGDDGKQFVKALLNRNPRHRLGASRDAAELKEHAFFSGIDWALLAQRKVEPPFKPQVESDESVECFDPEFTNADLSAFAPDEAVSESIDEDDPSESWTSPAIPAGVHTPNGPLGSMNPFFSPPLRTAMVTTPPIAPTPPATAPPTLEGSVAVAAAAAAAATSEAVAIGPAKRKADKTAAQAIAAKDAPPAESPIPGSMFQGFSFSGGESVAVPSTLAERAEAAAAAAEARAEDEGLNTEDEDFEKPGGRYANERRMKEAMGVEF